MRLTSVRLKLVLASTLTAVMAAGCTAGGTAPGGTAQPTDTGPKILRTALQTDVQTFDPDNGFEVAGLGAIRAVYEGLVDYKPGTTRVVGRLAKSWEISGDGRTYTFELREGVKFHGGAPMTAASVKAAFERRQTPSLALSYFLANVASLKAQDDKTFVVTLKAAQQSFLDSLASPWGPKVVGPVGLVDNAGSDKGVKWLNDHADGTGPYKLATFARGQQYVLERHDGYWGDKPYFDKVELKIVPDVGQQTLRLRNGELDVMLHGYPYAQLEALPAGLEVEDYDDLGIELAFVNPKRRLKTTEQRRRVMAAINPEAWVEDAFGEYASPALSLFPKAMLEPSKPYAWPGADEAKGAEVGPLEIAYNAEEAGVQQRVADLIIAQLGKAGIKATARSVPSSQVPGFTKNPAAAPDIFLAQNNPDSAHPDSQSSLFYATGGPLNIFTYSNPAADKLFAKAATLDEGRERDEMYAEGGRLVFEDGAFLPLADVKDVVVHRSGLTSLNTRPAWPWNIDFGTVRRG